MAARPFIGHLEISKRWFLTLSFPFPQASGPGPKPSECPHRLSTSAGAGCAACRGSSGPGWDWAPEKTQTPCLTQSGSLGALVLNAGTWPSITLGHLHVHGLTICFANHYPPLSHAPSTPAVSDSREIGTDVCDGLRHPPTPTAHWFLLAECCFLRLYSAMVSWGVSEGLRDACWKYCG